MSTKSRSEHSIADALRQEQVTEIDSVTEVANQARSTSLAMPSGARRTLSVAGCEDYRVESWQNSTRQHRSCS